MKFDPNRIHRRRGFARTIILVVATSILLQSFTNQAFALPFSTQSFVVRRSSTSHQRSNSIGLKTTTATTHQNHQNKRQRQLPYHQAKTKAPVTTTSLKMVQTEKRLEELGIVLPPAPKPAANYVPCQRSGDLLFLSGHLPLKGDGSVLTGRIGPGPDERSLEHGYDAAKTVGMNLIATLQQYLDGDLDRVVSIVKLFGIVQSSQEFHEQHKVINGCSDLMVQVFGPERGLHARSAIGTNALPLDISVEIEAIIRIKD